MDTSRQRDQSVERLLRQSLKASRTGVTDSCLDAETLAAWVDDGLSGAALAAAHAHVADCARCQSFVKAMAQAHSVASPPHREPVLRRWLPWLVPLTAAAAVVTLWVAVPRETTAPVASVPTSTQPRQTGETTVQQPALRDDQPRAPLPEAREARPEQTAENKTEREAPVSELGKETARRDSAPAAEPAAQAAAAAQPQPAAQGALAARSAATLAETVTISPEIVSPDVSVRWRIAGSALEHSTNGGMSWDAVPTGVTAVLTAGAAPTPTVCWVVGRGGVILLSIDGRTWRRLVFPEMTDLSAVQATDAATASVTTTDGRTFGTSNGGLTWTRR